MTRAWSAALAVASLAFMAGLVFLANLGRYGSLGALAGALLTGGGAVGAAFAFSRITDSNPPERRPER